MITKCKKCSEELEVRVVDAEPQIEVYHGYCKNCDISWILEIKVNGKIFK